MVAIDLVPCAEALAHVTQVRSPSNTRLETMPWRSSKRSEVGGMVVSVGVRSSCARKNARKMVRFITGPLSIGRIAVAKPVPASDDRSMGFADKAGAPPSPLDNGARSMPSNGFQGTTRSISIRKRLTGGLLTFSRRIRRQRSSSVSCGDLENGLRHFYRFRKSFSDVP